MVKSIAENQPKPQTTQPQPTIQVQEPPIQAGVPPIQGAEPPPPYVYSSQIPPQVTSAQYIYGLPNGRLLVPVEPPAYFFSTNLCPNCRIGMVSPQFTCPGICCAILCFPLGIICCLLMTVYRCSYCNAIF